MQAGLVARARAWIDGTLGRLPRPARRVLVGLIVAGLVAGAFAGVVLPLFHFGNPGPAMAEVAGLIPDRAQVNRSSNMEIAVDNTGVASIRPVCVTAVFDAPVRIDAVIFQGLDRVMFRNGRACGGRLNSAETINVRISLVPLSVGPVRVSVAPAEGGRTIGGDIHGVMRVDP